MTILGRVLGLFALAFVTVLIYVVYLDLANHLPDPRVLKPLPPPSPTPAAPVKAKNKKKAVIQQNQVEPVQAPSDSRVYRALPQSGLFRFTRAGEGDEPRVGPKGGRMDAFGNEWLAMVDHRGWLVSWKVHLSPAGRLRWRRAIGWRDEVFVAPGGGRWAWQARMPDFY